MSKIKQSPIKVAVILDAWFPRQLGKHGVYGSSQVHVRDLSKVMERKFPVTFIRFYPAHRNILYRSLWVGIGLVRIFQLHRKSPFSLIHVHGSTTCIVGKIASKLLHLPIIFTVHGSSRIDLKGKGFAAWWEKISLTKIKYSALISVSQSFLTHSNQNKHIFVIPNGVFTEDFDKIKVEKSSVPTIIWVGRDKPTKGLQVLRSSILKLRKKIPELKTKLISGGSLSGNMLIKEYKKAHVFVLPSLAEGQPISLLEAWAAKLPVVVTNVGDNGVMVKNGVNGYLVDPGNVLQLTAALLKTLRARTKNLTMGEAGYALVKSKYSWNNVANKTWKVYQMVLNGKIG